MITVSPTTAVRRKQSEQLAEKAQPTTKSKERKWNLLTSVSKLVAK